MAYHFRNLVFEGGGVKGIAYLGALEILEAKGILGTLSRIGGTSVGAINAVLLALEYTRSEQKEILWNLDFKKFEDNDWDILRNLIRVFNRFGWNKGSFFEEWMGNLVAEKLKIPNATFKDLKAANKPDLYIYGTNLCTRFGEVFSFERSPDMPIKEAVRISMSIPLYFTAVRKAPNAVYVDGGCLNNYPVKLFDREKYIQPENRSLMALPQPYYVKQNINFLKDHPDSSPYTYNKETLGFRLDSREEIAAFRYNEPASQKINNFANYATALVKTMLESQNNSHLHSDDWQRTIYIDTLGVGTTEFNLDTQKKGKLVNSGKDGTQKYFDWFDASSDIIVNRPAYTLPKSQ
jgi:NTE family protein